MRKAAFPQGRIKAVFFDVQGTLIDREASWRQAFAEAVGEFAARWDDGEFSAEDAADRFVRALASGGGTKRQRRSARSSRMAAMKAVLSGAPFAVTPSFLDSLYRRTEALVPLHPVPAPGVRDVLARLSRRYRLGIISNSPRRRITEMLVRAGLDGFFDGKSVFVPGGRLRGKPDKGLFLAALAAFRINPGEAVMVGDSWRKDVLGAVRCGMHAIHLHKGNKKTDLSRRNRSSVGRLARFSQLSRWLEH